MPRQYKTEKKAVHLIQTHSFFLLYIESEQNHIPILHLVLFSFRANQSLFASRGVTAAAHQILIGYYFSTDETTLKIGMNLSRRLRC